MSQWEATVEGRKGGKRPFCHPLAFGALAGAGKDENLASLDIPGHHLGLPSGRTALAVRTGPTASWCERSGLPQARAVSPKDSSLLLHIGANINYLLL